MTTRFRADKPQTRFRGNLVKFKTAPLVDRTGGMWKAGIIRGVSLCTRGEALGHYMWLDNVFIRQVFRGFVEQSSETGLKARFTHPGLSADGLAQYLGRYFDPELIDEDSRVLADLHFAASAHDTPDGDLAAYLMSRAEEDPLSFGLSITFRRDWGAEDKFVAMNENQDGEFTSPDADNTQRYRHARLAQLLGCDAVDEPAANPQGLFHRAPALALEATACYALGLSDQRPPATALDVDPDRLRDFANRFLKSHGLQIVGTKPEEDSMSVDLQQTPLSTVDASENSGSEADAPVTDNTTPAAGPGETSQPPAEEPPPAAAGSAPDAATVTLRRYLNLFGDAGGRYLAEGLTIEQAYGSELAELRRTAKELQDKLGAAEGQLAAVTDRKIKHATGHLEESKPLNTGRDTDGGQKIAFADLFKIRRN